MDPTFVRWAGLAGVIVVAWWLYRTFIAKRPADPHHVFAECGCGWSGQVSRYKPRCAKCGANLTV